MPTEPNDPVAPGAEPELTAEELESASGGGDIDTNFNCVCFPG